MTPSTTGAARVLVALALALSACVGEPGTSMTAATRDTPSDRDRYSRELEGIETLLDDEQYSKAEIEARELLAWVETRWGPETLQAADVLDLLVEALWAGGKAQAAESRILADRALQIREPVLDPGDIRIAASLRNLAEILRRSGNYEEAEPLYLKALKVKETALGKNDPAVEVIVRGLGNLYLARGQYAEARRYYERARAIMVETYGPDHPLLAAIIYNIAIVLRRMGRYEEARPLYERALAITEKNRGPDHSETAFYLNGYAAILDVTGDYSTGRIHYERSLKINERVFGADSLEVAGVLNNLGRLFQKIGDFEDARSSFERSLRIREEQPVPNDRLVAQSLHNLGRLLSQMGRLDPSTQHFERALKIRKKLLGEDHPHVATTLKYFARVLMKQGDLSRAQELYQEALQVLEKKFSPDHPDVVWCLEGLASIEARRGDYQAAKTRYERALRIHEKTLGPDHPMVAAALNNLGTLLWRTGDVAGLLDMVLRAEAISRSHLSLTARTLPERQALRYASTRTSGLDLALTFVSTLDDPTRTRRVWDAAIRSRALVLDEMASRHRTLEGIDDAVAAKLRRRLALARTRLATLAIRGPDSHHAEGYRELLEKARKDKERAERDLAEVSEGFRNRMAGRDVTLPAIAKHLPDGTALVAFVLYDHQVVGPSQVDTIPSFVAFVLGAGESEPALVPLGTALEIDSLVSMWKEEAARGALISGRSRSAIESAYRAAGGALRRKVWDPVASELGDARQVFIVPDGSLYLVSMASLPVGESAYLIESGPLIHTLSAERDVVVSHETVRKGAGLIALGGPDFDRDDRPARRGSAVQISVPSGSPGAAVATPYRGPLSTCREFRSLRFGLLPAAAREAEEVVRLWKRTKSAGTSPLLLVGARADERAFKTLAPGRRVLHLATHGFFLGEQCGSAPGTLRGIGGLVPEQTQKQTSPPLRTLPDNPLLLSGLVLAGANERETASPDEEDGILTAEEIAALDLRGVEWAVLSACNTGVGKVDAGEGVLGLQRAFHLAGVSTVIMSLWSVEDTSTRRWMQALYEGRLERGLSTAESVRRASLSLLNGRREASEVTHPFYWAAFVAAGDWR